MSQQGCSTEDKYAKTYYISIFQQQLDTEILKIPNTIMITFKNKNYLEINLTKNK